MSLNESHNIDWITILKCPISEQDLTRLSVLELEEINNKIQSGKLRQLNGEATELSISDGLVTTDKKYIYPIKNEILILLKELALVDSENQNINDKLGKDKSLVQNFYDSEGWNMSSDGNYKDADLFEDLRSVSENYIRKCHERVSLQLPKSGKFLLDAASGALQYNDYLSYSEGFKYRICVDLSISGLLECKRKLGDKAICVLCDITKLPFKDHQIDGFVSLNTIYHIPKDEQVKAINELYRVLIKNGRGVVVYDWFKYSLWMNVALLPIRTVSFISNRIKKMVNKISNSEQEKMLYFFAHKYSFFKENLPPFKLVVWRSISVHFMKIYIHQGFFGKSILDWVWSIEEKYPEKCGLHGEYPMFVFEKK
jgi:ubiquinone/menaquinone biosynthesis C-methylase UbiE/uncharacterized protein YbaR (Trm112 family)